MSKILFVTGTDTGVGKTVLTTALLHYLRESGVNALAMKPFCSGDREDVARIQQIQGLVTSVDEINPFYFKAPLSPWAASCAGGRTVVCSEALKAIRRLEGRCERLIVEGVGGVMVPLGRRFTVADLIAELGGDVVIVGRNRLGTINHTLLTVEALRGRKVERVKVVLMEEETRDRSARTNRQRLSEWLAPVWVCSLPFLGPDEEGMERVKRNSKKLKKVLAQILDPDTFSAPSGGWR